MTNTSETKASNRPGRAARREAVNTLKRKYLRQDFIAISLFFLVMLLVPFLPTVKGWMLSQASLVIIYVIAALGVMVLVGFVGLVSVGHGGFLAIGAYTSALLSTHYGTDLIVGIIAAMAMSALIGTFLALVFLRLSGAFMAIGTLGFAFFIGAIVNNVPLFQGRDGMLLDDNVIIGIEIGDRGFFYVATISLILVCTFIFCLKNSGTGRAFMALRDSEKAAMSSGVNRLKYRTLAFSISAAITGMAGALNAHVVNYVSSEVYGDIWYSVDILIAVVVGGPTLIFGPIIGGLFVVMVPFFFEQLADFSFIMKGVVLILVLRFAPAGVAALLFYPFTSRRQARLRLEGGSEFDGESSK